MEYGNVTLRYSFVVGSMKKKRTGQNDGKELETTNPWRIVVWIWMMMMLIDCEYSYSKYHLET
jgi:hypothetical protein